MAIPHRPPGAPPGPELSPVPFTLLLGQSAAWGPVVIQGQNPCAGRNTGTETGSRAGTAGALPPPAVSLWAEPLTPPGLSGASVTKPGRPGQSPRSRSFSGDRESGHASRTPGRALTCPPWEARTPSTLASPVQSFHSGAGNGPETERSM